MPSKDMSITVMKRTFFLILLALFLWNTHKAWEKYSEGSTIVVSDHVYPEKQTFPSITFCKGRVLKKNETVPPPYDHGIWNSEERLDAWLVYFAFEDEE